MPESDLRSATVLLVSLGFGLIGNLLFYNQSIGINVGLFMLLYVGVGVWLVRRFQQPVVWYHAAFGVLAVLFTVLLGIYSAPPLVLLNIIMALGTLFIFLNYSSTEAFLGGSVLAFIGRSIWVVCFGWIGTFVTGAESLRWFARANNKLRYGPTTSAVLRGLLLTIPLVMIFGGLLASADVVFRRSMMGFVDWLIPNDLGSIPDHLMVIGLISLVSMFGLAMLLVPYLLYFDWGGSEVAVEVSPPQKRGFQLSLIESGMMLGALDVLFLLFMIIQARYLFGGEANITTQGFTYAQYARRGFYELVQVSVLTILVVLSLDAVTRRKNEQEYIFQVFASGMIILTMLMLGAAYYRLSLYEDAYGYTLIRVTSGVFMVWLGVLLAVLLMDILIKKRRLFWVGVVVTALGFALTLNFMNLDGFIAQRNIDRTEGEIDVIYLLTLSNDAVPELVKLLDRDDLSDTDRRYLRTDLSCRLNQLEQRREARSFLEFNLSEDHAWRTLNRYRDELPFDYLCTRQY